MNGLLIPDIVWASGGGFCRFLVLVEGLQVAEVHLASRDQIQFISCRISLRSPAAQGLDTRFLSSRFQTSLVTKERSESRHGF